MSTLRYSGGEYNAAEGTRNAFGAFSDDLVRAGLPGVVVNSGDREPATQVRIFTERFRQQASGSGPFGDVRFWNGAGWGFPGGTRWVRHSSAGTVAVPGTSTHERRRSNDLGWPYNSLTTSHIRAREIGRRHNIVCDGLNFGEPWHWTFQGALGAVGSAASSGATALIIPPKPVEGDDMIAFRWNKNHVFVIGPEQIAHLDNYEYAKAAATVHNPDQKWREFDDLGLTTALITYGVPWSAVDACMRGVAYDISGAVGGHFWSRSVEQKIDTSRLAKSIEDLRRVAESVPKLSEA